MARAGAPFELIARQLGHREVAMVAKVYGRFKPDTEERARWERVATARDQEKWHRPASAEGANAEKVDEAGAVTDWKDDSRGGTRTRDPGIMRNGAVPAPTLSRWYTPCGAPRNTQRATVHSAMLSAGPVACLSRATEVPAGYLSAIV